MAKRDRPNALFADESGIEGYVTDRLLAFYDGLIERGQISPPIAATQPEDPTISRCRVELERGLNPSRSEGV
jgi:hypothetical protein